jgi:hypothetical protein
MEHTALVIPVHYDTDEFHNDVVGIALLLM